MSEEIEQEQTPKTEPLTRAERIFIRLSIAQTVMAIAGIFTGVIALYAALTESDAVRKQQAASVLPEIVIAQSQSISEEEGQFSWNAYNWGIGPGRVRAVKVTFKGEPVKDWRELLDKMEVERGVPYYQSQLSGRTIPASETSMIFKTTDREAAIIVRNKANDVDVELCYCSVFETCWMMKEWFRKPAEKIKACPDYGEDAFVQ